MKSCRLIKQEILRAVDGDLSVGEVLRMDAHLEGCVSCREYRDEQLTLNELLELLPEPALDRLDAKRAMASIQGKIDEHSRGDKQAQVAQAERAAWERPLRTSVPKKWAMGFILLAASVLLAVGLWPWPAPAPVEALPVALSTGAQPMEVAAQPIANEQADEGKLDLAQAIVEEQPVTRVEVQAALRSSLLLAFESPQLGSNAERQLEVFDGHMDASYSSWPLATMCEALLGHPDASLAGAAARYLGLRGGRLSLASLKAGLQRSEVAPACVQALADLGPLGIEALALAMDDSSLSALALERLGGVHEERAAKLVGAALLKSPRDPGATTLFLNTLARIGRPSMPTLLHLAQAQPAARVQVVATMATLEGAGEELARLVSAKDASYPDALIFELVDQFGSPEILPWLEEKLGAYEHRQRALRSLGALPGVAPLIALAELAQKGSLGEQELLQVFGALAKAGPRRMTAHAEGLLDAGDAHAASQYLSLLISCDEAGAANALALLALSDLLTGEERQWAALAVGELGVPEAASTLAAAFAAGEFSERRLMAACLISVFRSLGEEGVHEALGSYPLGAVNAVFDALVAATTDPKPQEGAVQLFRIARVLNLATNGRNSNLGQSSL